MKIVNNSEQFVVMFNGKDYTIPKGEFEVADEKLASHIINKAFKWGKNITQVPDSTVEAVKAIDKIEPVEIKPVEPPVFSGATMETLPKHVGRPKKNVE